MMVRLVSELRRVSSCWRNFFYNLYALISKLVSRVGRMKFHKIDKNLSLLYPWY